MAFTLGLSCLWFLCFVHVSLAGSAVNPEKWIVSIEQNNETVCEGVLLKKDWVLTLGDCIPENNWNNSKIVTSNGEVRDIDLEKRSTVARKKLVLLRTSTGSDVEQGYPRLSELCLIVSKKPPIVYISDESGARVETSITLISDCKCFKARISEDFSRDEHDCFTVDSAECLVKPGLPIFQKQMKEWIILGFSTTDGDICNNTYKLSTSVALYESWAEETLQDCGLPPSVSNGSVVLDSSTTSVGSTANVSCDLGYTPVAATIYCQASGVWETPVCAPRGLNTSGLPPLHPRASQSSSQLRATTRATTRAPFSPYSGGSRRKGNAGLLHASFARRLSANPEKWIVSIEQNNETVCEGVLLRKNWVLTLGDCIPENNWNKSKIVTSSGEVRDIDLEKRSTVARKKLVLLRTSTGSDVGQGYPKLSELCTRVSKSPKVYISDESDTRAETSITMIGDCKCFKAGLSEDFSGDEHDCFTAANPECLVKPGLPIFQRQMKEWILLGFSTTDGDICNNTYKLSQSVALYESWVENTLQDCGLPPSVSNGSVVLDSSTTSVGSTANVSCDLGYTPVAATIYCQASGIWETPVCEPRDCGLPPSVSNGSVVLDSSVTTFGSTATVSCDSGYGPSATTIACQASGVWETPVCRLLNFTCSDGSKAVECDCNYECSDSLDEALCDCIELSREFFTIPRYYISGFGLGFGVQANADECKNLCLLDEDNCKSAEVNGKGVCSLNSVTPAEQPDAFRASTNTNLYLRKCSKCVK